MAWFTSDYPDFTMNETIKLKPGKKYDIWLIDIGGPGSRGGSNWGLYKGKGGSCGAAGSAGHLQFVVSYKIDLYAVIGFKEIPAQYDAFRFPHIFIELKNTPEETGVCGFLKSPTSRTSNNVARDAENAGAFNPSPTGGYNGISLEITSTLVSENAAYDKNYEFINETIRGNPTSQQGPNNSTTGKTAESAAVTPFSVPPFLAGPGQNAYYSTDLNSICLGNAGGGGNGGGQAGGAGSPGGIIIIEEGI